MQSLHRGFITPGLQLMIIKGKKGEVFALRVMLDVRINISLNYQSFQVVGGGEWLGACK